MLTQSWGRIVARSGLFQSQVTSELLAWKWAKKRYSCQINICYIIIVTTWKEVKLPKILSKSLEIFTGDSLILIIKYARSKKRFMPMQVQWRVSMRKTPNNVLHIFIYFLGAKKHLYNWLCPSVSWLVCRLDGLLGNAFVRRSTRCTYWPTWPCFYIFSPWDIGYTWALWIVSMNYEVFWNKAGYTAIQSRTVGQEQ